MTGRRRHFAIFTTASLPWMTDTAINPLFRAAYLAQDGHSDVTLIIPWLSLQDQDLVYPNKIKFNLSSEQEDYVRNWLHQRTAIHSNFTITFYPGKVLAFKLYMCSHFRNSQSQIACLVKSIRITQFYNSGKKIIYSKLPLQFSKEKRSILPVGDLTEIVLDEVADIAVLEELEHLTWYYHGRRWKMKFRKVIGIVHTNYLAYVKREKNGFMQAFLLKHINSWVTDIYCHKVIRLSAATQELERSVICNVHGVNPRFLEIGKQKQKEREIGGGEKSAYPKGAYYIGKMVWGKGYTELLQLLGEHQKELTGLKMELYGNGEDSGEVKEAAAKLKLDVTVLPANTDYVTEDPDAYSR